MIFSDISTFSQIIAEEREQSYRHINNSTDGSRIVSFSLSSKNGETGLTMPIATSISIFHDTKDQTVDKWYNSSPPMTGNAVFLYEFEESAEDSISDVSKVLLTPDKPNKETSHVGTEKEKTKEPVISALKNGNDADDMFKPIPVEKIKSMDQNEENKKVSLLSDQLSTLTKGRPKGDGIPLLIYLPNCVETLNINVPKKSHVVDIIKYILKDHEDNRMLPPLDYDSPRNYELRMHEGDGEPDMDFAPFELDQDVNSIYQTSQSNEFCLCEKDEDNTSDDSDFIALRRNDKSTSNNINVGNNNNNNNNGNRGPPPMYRVDSASVSDDAVTKSDVVSRAENEIASLSQSNKLSENAILISIPNTGVVGVNINDKTTLRDVLPLIATKHKLRLYIDEFSFNMIGEEQKRLHLMSPIADMDVPIKSIGASEFELQRKVYADAAKIARPKSEVSKSFDINRSPMDTNKVLYNDTTASVYQEWIVVKKNKFGRRQDRYIGIDGDKVYNSKRGQYANGSTGGGVYRAQRDISLIRKVELVREDPELKTLRITWVENRDVYDIEYTCETQRDCNEIIAKLKYLMKRNQIAGGLP